ncbi:hypothetical protein D6029_11300 [Buttiauxella izardii]|uniref:Uncharacterized protein n=1 Tax=Buttiauxella izardii TaxID=82991 RepID=A0A3A5JQL8_9ENTR|nr:hypothetical protein D6029_11300 [Buttiauxella izardii]
MDISATFINTLVISLKPYQCQVKSIGAGKLRLYDEIRAVYCFDDSVLMMNDVDMDKLFLMYQLNSELADA